MIVIKKKITIVLNSEFEQGDNALLATVISTISELYVDETWMKSSALTTEEVFQR